MKYIKTYEGLFNRNHHREILKLGNAIYSTIKQYKDFSKDFSKNNHSFWINFIDSTGNLEKYIMINFEIRFFVIYIFEQNELYDLSNFLQNFFSKFAADKRDYISTMKPGYRFWIESESIQKIVEELKNIGSELNLHVSMNNYNL